MKTRINVYRESHFPGKLNFFWGSRVFHNAFFTPSMGFPEGAPVSFSLLAESSVLSDVGLVPYIVKLVCKFHQETLKYIG
jgi:hypothetical protein